MMERLKADLLAAQKDAEAKAAELEAERARREAEEARKREEEEAERRREEEARKLEADGKAADAALKKVAADEQGDDIGTLLKMLEKTVKVVEDESQEDLLSYAEILKVQVVSFSLSLSLSPFALNCLPSTLCPQLTLPHPEDG